MSMSDSDMMAGFPLDEMIRGAQQVDSEVLGWAKARGNSQELNFDSAVSGVGFATTLSHWAEFKNLHLIRIPNMKILHSEDAIALAMFELAAPGMNTVVAGPEVRKQIDDVKQEMGKVPLENLKRNIDEFNTNRSRALGTRSDVPNQFSLPESESLTFGETFVISKCMATTMSFPKLQHISEKGLRQLLSAMNLASLDIPVLQNPTDEMVQLLAKFEMDRTGKVTASPLVETLIGVRRTYLEEQLYGPAAESGDTSVGADEEPGF